MHKKVEPLSTKHFTSIGLKLGFTGFDNGKERAPYIEVILKQQYVDNAVQATHEEICSFMQALGFTQINEANYKNDNYIVADLYPRKY